MTDNLVERPDDTDFRLGDIVETVKGAAFWGEIIAFDNDAKSPGCTVLAVAPGFTGTKHVYPLAQLRQRARTETAEPVAVKALVWGPYPNPTFAGPDVAVADIEFHHHYQVQRDPWAPGYMAYLYPTHGSEYWNSKGHETLEAAKAAAQADYEARIRSALASPPAPAVTEGMRTGPWKMSINYGPDGEENWANVSDQNGSLVGNLRTHHAMAIVEAFAALSAPPAPGVDAGTAKRWPRKGDRMRFLNQNGYDHDRIDALKVMKEGDVLTVKSIDVGEWHHTIEFEEVGGRHNGVMFVLLPKDESK